MFRFLPEQASEVAPKIDWLNNLITDLSIFFTVAIVGTMLYFAIRYRKKGGEDHETPRIEGSEFLEIVWTVVPIVISAYIMYWGIAYYRDLQRVEANPITIDVTGYQFGWNFQYANGKSLANEFYVPVNKPIKLVMRSKDVLHSFFIPSMRVKADVLPTQYSYVTFKPVKVGTYKTFCTEYCGSQHYNMMTKLHVVPEGEYERWLEDKTDEILASKMKPSDIGRELYTKKTCSGCHSIDGSRLIGPSFLGLYGKKREFSNGDSVTADEKYIEESVYYPQKRIVKGFESIPMTQFAPEKKSESDIFSAYVTSEELGSIIAFIRTLDESAAPAATPEPEAEVDLSKLSPAEKGELVYKNNLCATCHSIDGSRIIGPSFQGLYGRQGEFTDGASYTADDAYIIESIREPSKHIVKGFEGAVMPPFPQLSEDDVKNVIEFMKTIQ